MALDISFTLYICWVLYNSGSRLWLPIGVHIFKITDTILVNIPIENHRFTKSGRLNFTRFYAIYHEEGNTIIIDDPLFYREGTWDSQVKWVA